MEGTWIFSYYNSHWLIIHGMMIILNIYTSHACGFNVNGITSVFNSIILLY